MHRPLMPRRWLTTCGLVATLVGCRPKSDQVSATAASAGKVPITTRSEEARKLYLQGRGFVDQIRGQDGRSVLEQAVAKDSTFALAHYTLAFASPTAKEFLEHLNAAVALSGQASDGERLMILQLQAAANASPAASRQYAESLVAKYPQDERAHLTLGNVYLNEQQYEKAIAELKKAVEIAPDFSPAYNALGYAYRPVGNYAEAERAFKKYIELVPADPNPYDSYAELLMKMGRFDESIAQYRKALSIDRYFVSSYAGIAWDLTLQGKYAAAMAEADQLSGVARNDGDRRGALFSRTVIDLDQGKTDLALQEMTKQYAMGAAIGDTFAMAGDATGMGDILLEAGKPKEAGKHYAEALQLITRSGLAQDLKDDAKVADHCNRGRVALKENDLATAEAEAKECLTEATARHNEARVRQAHELAGAIASGEKKFEAALAELAQGNQQDPYVLFRTALAYDGKGDKASAKDMFHRAADMNVLPTLSYALVRVRAKQLATRE